MKDRCITHDDQNIFYTDNNHPVLKGSEMINNLIMKEIELIGMLLLISQRLTQHPMEISPVSYTHLTLPTICSV